MKIAIIVIRTIVGLLLIMSSVFVLFKLAPQPELTGNMKTFNEGVAASGYLMTLIKVIELICGIAFVTGRFNPLATVVLFPITVNIFMVHLLLAPEGLPVAIFLLLSNLFLAYAYRKNYEGLWAIQ